MVCLILTVQIVLNQIPFTAKKKPLPTQKGAAFRHEKESVLHLHVQRFVEFVLNFCRLRELFQVIA